MELQLYNTLTREKAEFRPLEGIWFACTHADQSRI